MRTTFKKPDIVQAFDYYVDREYHKVQRGFIFGYDDVIRADRMKDWKIWHIECESMPDEIFINGKEYSLSPTER